MHRREGTQSLTQIRTMHTQNPRFRSPISRTISCSLDPCCVPPLHLPRTASVVLRRTEQEGALLTNLHRGFRTPQCLRTPRSRPVRFRSRPPSLLSIFELLHRASSRNPTPRTPHPEASTKPQSALAPVLNISVVISSRPMSPIEIPPAMRCCGTWYLLRLCTTLYSRSPFSRPEIWYVHPYMYTVQRC